MVEEGLHDAIVVDPVLHSFETKDALLKRLTAHVTRNMIRIKGKLYQQVRGIAQVKLPGLDCIDAHSKVHLCFIHRALPCPPSFATSFTATWRRSGWAFAKARVPS